MIARPTTLIDPPDPLLQRKSATKEKPPKRACLTGMVQSLVELINEGLEGKQFLIRDELEGVNEVVKDAETFVEVGASVFLLHGSQVLVVDMSVDSKHAREDLLDTRKEVLAVVAASAENVLIIELSRDPDKELLNVHGRAQSLRLSVLLIRPEVLVVGSGAHRGAGVGLALFRNESVNDEQCVVRLDHCSKKAVQLLANYAFPSAMLT